MKIKIERGLVDKENRDIRRDLGKKGLIEKEGKRGRARKKERLIRKRKVRKIG